MISEWVWSYYTLIVIVIVIVIVILIIILSLTLSFSLLFGKSYTNILICLFLFGHLFVR